MLRCSIVVALLCASLTACGKMTDEDLFEQALHAPSPAEREAAAVQLARRCEAEMLATPPDRLERFLDESENVRRLRTLLAESDTPEVRAAAAAGLGDVRDYESLPELLDLMESESTVMRMRSGKAVEQILGAGFGFDPYAAATDRAQSVEAYRRFYQEALGPHSPSRELNVRRMGPLGAVSQESKG